MTVTGNVTGVTATGLSCEVKSFTLTRNVYNSSYGSAYTVNRTSSPYQGAATGTISFNSQNKATVYYGDKFSVTCTAKSDTYGA